MNPPDLAQIWVYLAQKPLTGLTLTLCAYVVGDWLYEKSGRNPLLNPVPIAIILIAGLLWTTGIPYKDYFEGAQFVHFLLGPATVALAVPLYQQLETLKESGPALLIGILVGSGTAAGCAYGFAYLGGASVQTLLSIAPKSVTAPIAMGRKALLMPWRLGSPKEMLEAPQVVFTPNSSRKRRTRVKT